MFPSFLRQKENRNRKVLKPLLSEILYMKKPKKNVTKKTKESLPTRYTSYLKDPLTKKLYKSAIDEYTKVAYIYDDRWKQYNSSTENAILQQLKLKGKETILDAGCGTGNLIAAIRTKFKHKGLIIGFDITPAMLDLAEAKLSFKSKFNKTLQLELAHCENFSAKDRSVDIVISSSVLHHLPHPEKAIKEFQRVLKKNGRLLLLDFCNNYPSTRLYDFYARLFHKSHHRAYSTANVEELLKHNKFKIVSFKTWKASPVLGVMLFEARRK